MKKIRQFVGFNDRSGILTARQSLKMARSAHAYVRGNTRKFYEWLETSDIEAVPHGPTIWICGDCHVGNLGPIANTDGHIDIQIRDLDQTVIGNPADDLIRLGLSLATFQAAAPRYPRARMPRDNAERVVEGARHLAPNLGQRMLAARLFDRAVFLRELLPQDLQLEIEHLTRDEAMKAAHFLAAVVGHAHARQMNVWRRKSGRTI
jgi:uncharacterized protein (DUF2252 family)